jgi:hypothetical protein
MGQPESLWKCALLALLAAGVPHAAASQPLETDHSRIRTRNPAVVRLLADGAARSPTFAALVDRLERTRWRVFLERGRCPGAAAGACLLSFVGTYNAEPYLRVLIDERRLGHPDRQIGAIAHELQHALEVAESSDVVDTATLVALFRRIGYVRQDSSRGLAYETDAARRVGEKVLGELGSDKRPRR